MPLVLGWDFGLTPACVVCQLSPRGQLRVIREYVCERGGIRELAREVVKPVLLNEFAGLRILSAGDPAGLQKSQMDAKTCIGELISLGIPTEAAPTNDFIARRQAVMSFLTRSVEGGPGRCWRKLSRQGWKRGRSGRRVMRSSMSTQRCRRRR